MIVQLLHAEPYFIHSSVCLALIFVLSRVVKHSVRPRVCRARTTRTSQNDARVDTPQTQTPIGMRWQGTMKRQGAERPRSGIWLSHSGRGTRNKTWSCVVSEACCLMVESDSSGSEGEDQQGLAKGTGRSESLAVLSWSAAFAHTATSAIRGLRQPPASY